MVDEGVVWKVRGGETKETYFGIGGQLKLPQLIASLGGTIPVSTSDANQKTTMRQNQMK